MHKPHAGVDRPLLSDLDSAEVIAAVDLGSNSFHMIVAELRHGQLAVIDRLRETVRLAEGLSDQGDLSDGARNRALDCLARFGERLRDMHASRVRAAGTSTIRRAREDSTFLVDAEALLGHPIDVISGIEEARLVYNGVTHSMPPTDGHRLVCDIGGGSTEVILGQAGKPLSLESLHMGCVSMTERFFADGRLTRERFERARMAARLELRPVKTFFRNAVGAEAIGTSGTIMSSFQIAQAFGFADLGMNKNTLDALIDKVLEFETIGDLSIRGLSPRRAQVWPGGLAILAELVSTLGISDMRVSQGALREGLLYDLLGRLSHEDARERTVDAMASRYQIDAQQATRVSETALALLEQCRDVWNLQEDLFKLALEWAARLHEIGLNISHDGYQRHGAYMAEHADMPGFPRNEQRLLAVLIGSQRHRINLSAVSALPLSWREPAVRLTAIFRLAVLLNRNRSDTPIPDVRLSVHNDQITISFGDNWLDENALTLADLERESALLAGAGYTLNIS